MRAARAILILALVAGPARADEAPVEPRRLTLAETLDLARKNAPRIVQLEALRTAADAGLRGARAGRLPQVDLSGSYTRQSNVPELVVAIPGLPPRTIFPNIPDLTRFRGLVTQPLYTGGRVSAAIDAAREQQRAAEADVLAGRSDLELEATSAYWSLVTARQTIGVTKEAVAAFDAHLKDAGNRLEEGVAARNEVLAVQVERARAELLQIQARSAGDVAEANLARLTGLPAGIRLEPVEALDPTAPAVDASATADLIAQAAKARPEIAALSARVRAAEAAARMAGAAQRPQAAATASYDYARPNARILPLTDEFEGTWALGVSVTWNAFDGGRTSAAAAQARAQADAVRQQRDDVTRRVRLEVTQRALELRTAREALEVAEKSVAAARENRDVAQDRYREGVSPSSDLLDAEVTLLRAGLDRTAALTQIEVAKAALARAVGSAR